MRRGSRCARGSTPPRRFRVRALRAAQRTGAASTSKARTTLGCPHAVLCTSVAPVRESIAAPLEEALPSGPGKLTRSPGQAQCVHGRGRALYGDALEPEHAPRPTENAHATSSAIFIPGRRSNFPEPNTHQDSATVARTNGKCPSRSRCSTRSMPLTPVIFFLRFAALLGDAFHAHATVVLSRSRRTRRSSNSNRCRRGAS